VDEILRQREPHRGIDPNEFFDFKEVGTTVRGSAEDLRPIEEPILLEGSQLLQEERGLGELLSVQGATVLVRLDGYPREEAGGNLVPRPDLWTP